MHGLWRIESGGGLIPHWRRAPCDIRHMNGLWRNRIPLTEDLHFTELGSPLHSRELRDIIIYYVSLYTEFDQPDQLFFLLS